MPSYPASHAGCPHGHEPHTGSERAQFLLGSETARENLGLYLTGCESTASTALDDKCRVMQMLSDSTGLRWRQGQIHCLITWSPRLALSCAYCRIIALRCI